MPSEDHLSSVGNQEASDEINARPEDLSSVYISLAVVEEEGIFAEEENGS